MDYLGLSSRVERKGALSILLYYLYPGTDSSRPTLLQLLPSMKSELRKVLSFLYLRINNIEANDGQTVLRKLTKIHYQLIITITNRSSWFRLILTLFILCSLFNLNQQIHSLCFIPSIIAFMIINILSFAFVLSRL